MKKIIILTILIFAFIGSFATPLTENFDTLVTSGYGNYTYNGWSITAGIAETTASKQRNGTKALRLNKSTTFGENLISPMKTGGIGNISFWYRHWDGDANVLGYDIEISQNGTTWTTIGTITNFNSTTYTQFNVAVNNAAAAYIRIIHTSGNERLIIDDISITDFSSTGCTGYKRDTIQNEICSFDSINFRGAYYKGTGFYSDTVISSSSVICDSIYTLNLSTKNSTLYPFNASICSTNDSILFKGNYLKTAGKYYDTITRIGNCDSIAELNLSLNYCPTPCSELFISEYIEGGGNNKALEFYNPTSTTINLTGYSIVVLRGSSNDTIQLSGMVLANDVHVISHASASLVNIIAHSDATAPIYYNGDDVIYLLKGNIVIDAFGNLPLAGNYAKDNTYQRKTIIQNGNLTYNVSDWNVLPKDIGELNLTHLSLNNNQISKLPNSITKLKNLDTLYLHNNKINKLPNEIGDLVMLIELSLGMNSLSYLPESISNLKSLKTLSINRNGTKKLPENFGNLSSLETLNSEYNLLKELPKSFGNLTSLKRLVLTNNNLQKLPENFGNLEQLTHLYLYNSKNQSSVFLIYDHTKGKLINDSHKGYKILKNNITKFPESFSNLKSLNYVELSRNENINSKQLFNLLKKSESKNYSLSLENCNIKELPNSGWNSLKVKTLNVRDNKISKLPKNIIKARFLTSLNLNRNKGTDFYIGSKAQLRILFAEKKFLTFNQLPKNNEMVKAYAKLANNYSYKKKYPKTVEYANRALAINKKLTHNFLHQTKYIEALFYTKNYSEVIKLADNEIRRDTSRGMRILNFIIPNFTYKAKSQLVLGDTIQAIKTFEIVSKKFNGNQWSLMALLSKKIKKDSLAKIYFNKSFDYYKNYLKTNDKNLGYHLSLLEAYVVANHKTQAINYYNLLMKRNITNQNYKYLLKYFDLIINIDDSNYDKKYNLLREELLLEKYILSNWSFELLHSWNDLNNATNQKEKIIKLTNLLSQSK